MKKTLFFLMLLGVCYNVKAYDFAVINSDGDSIFYNIISNVMPYQVEVTHHYDNTNAMSSLYPSYVGNVIIPASVTYNDIEYAVTGIGYDAFIVCAMLNSIELPNTIKYVDWNAFSNANHLTTLNLPNSIDTMGHYVFNNCERLTSINLPDSIRSIGKYMFFDCKSLSSITLPNKVTYIDQNAFQGCTSLKSIHFPSSLQNIGPDIFRFCDSISSIRVDAIIPPITEFLDTVWYPFIYIDKNIPVYVPCESLELYQNSPTWSYFTNIQCQAGLPDDTFVSENIKLYPNPASNKTTLEVEGLKNNADVIVYDLQGRAIKTYKINARQTNLEIDVKSFAKGIYNIKLVNSDCNITKKLIVK